MFKDQMQLKTYSCFFFFLFLRRKRQSEAQNLNLDTVHPPVSHVRMTFTHTSQRVHFALVIVYEAARDRKGTKYITLVKLF